MHTINAFKHTGNPLAAFSAMILAVDALVGPLK
jgi:hypothetical protein